MQAIQIKNLRSLADTGWVDLKPITLLLGQNSSGKSTFLRAFPLLRQSVEVNTAGPILWYGDYVDFGDFQTAVNKFASWPHVGFSFLFPMTVKDTNFLSMRRGRSLILDNLDLELILRITRNKRNESQIRDCHLLLEGHEIRLKFDPEGKGDSTEFRVNERNFLDHGQFRNSSRNGLIPHLTIKGSEDITIRQTSYQNLWLDQLIQEAKKQVHQNTSDSSLQELVRSFGVGKSRAMLEAMQGPHSITSWTKSSQAWTINSPEFKKLRDLVIAYKLPELLSFADAYITEFAKNVHYIAPLRVTAARYYRLQNLAVTEIDSQGQNLAMFLNNLTEGERKGFAAWTKEFFGFVLQTRQSGDHISLQLQECGADNAFNLTDMGFGFSQMLPVLTQLWVLSNRRRPRRFAISYYLDTPTTPITFAIEQPELHLHPRLQAKLADACLAVIEAAKPLAVDLRLLIETHSETMVNRFGHHIANQKMDHQDINVVLFEKDRVDAPSQVRFSAYDEEGFLTNWPFGFFEPVGV